MLGTPKTMQVDPHYADVVDDVGDFLRQAVDRAVEAGIDASLLIVDPGFGFGKTFEHNLQLLNGLHRLQPLNQPLLVGTSRKAFIRHLLKPPGEADLPADLPSIAAGTQATVAAAALQGAHIIRVHDVAATRATLTIIDAIRNADGDAPQERQGVR
jgi:dihydropteroate synthase